MKIACVDCPRKLLCQKCKKQLCVRRETVDCAMEGHYKTPSGVFCTSCWKKDTR